MLRKFRYFICCGFLYSQQIWAMDPYLIINCSNDLTIRSAMMHVICTRDEYPDHYARCDLPLPVARGARMTITTGQVYDALDAMENNFDNPARMNAAFVHRKEASFPYRASQDIVLWIKIKAFNARYGEHECQVNTYNSPTYQQIYLSFGRVDEEIGLIMRK